MSRDGGLPIGGVAYNGPCDLPDGGEGGIRTHGTVARTSVFETDPIDRSGTSPRSGAGRISCPETRRNMPALTDFPTGAYIPRSAHAFGAAGGRSCVAGLDAPHSSREGQ